MDKTTFDYLKHLFSKKDAKSIEGRRRVCDTLKRQFNALYETGYSRSKTSDSIDSELSYRMAQEYYFHLKELGFSFEFQSYSSPVRAGQVYRVNSVFYGPKDIGLNPFTHGDPPSFMIQEIKVKKSELVAKYKTLKDSNYDNIKKSLILLREEVIINFGEDTEFVHRATMINSIVGLAKLMISRASHMFDMGIMQVRKLESNETIHYPQLVSHLVEMDSELLFDIGSHMEVFLLLESLTSINYSKTTNWPEYFTNTVTDREYLGGEGPFGKYIGKEIKGTGRKTTDILYKNPYSKQEFVIKTDHAPGQF